MLRTLAAGAFLLLGAVADEPTKGRTDGEPGTGEHCCGMKGLGGATVQVLCHPDTVALGQEFTVNVAYTTDIKRPVDVHVDLLNAQNKQVRRTEVSHHPISLSVLWACMHARVRACAQKVGRIEVVGLFLPWPFSPLCDTLYVAGRSAHPSLKGSGGASRGRHMH
jgi:hypothetical protein